jgi:hypothetical protein
MSNAAATLNSTAATGGSFNLFGGLARFFETLAAARRCSAAINAGRRPTVRDLEVLDLQGLNFDNLLR